VARRSKPEPDDVIFRWWQGEVIALFPKQAWPGYCATPGCVMSFMHVGQHGEANYRHIIRESKPATRKQFAELKKELESPPYGYNLVVRQRQNPR